MNFLKRETQNRSMTGDAPEQAHLAHQMHRAWIAFARISNPTILELSIQ